MHISPLNRPKPLQNHVADGLGPQVRPQPSEAADPTRKTQQTGEPIVEISPEAQKLRAANTLLHAMFGGIEQEVSAEGRVAFEAAGRSEYRTAISKETDASPDAAAAQILGGITGYIYHAFLAQTPGITSEDFERFKNQVMAGFEQGLRSARETLARMGKPAPAQAQQIDQIEARVRAQLRRFFERQGEKFGHRNATNSSSAASTVSRSDEGSRSTASVTPIEA